MSRARELAKFGGSGQQVIAGVSSHVGVSTFAAKVFMYQDLSVSGNINVTGDLSYDEVSARNQFTSGITTTADLIVTRNANFSGIITASNTVAPNANNTVSLGTSENRWSNVFSNDLDLSNEGSTNDIDGTWGSFLVQEGEESLYIINRRSGKKFRFVLEELV